MTAETIAERLHECGVPDPVTITDPARRQILIDIILGFVDGGVLYVYDCENNSKFVALVVDKKAVLQVYC